MDISGARRTPAELMRTYVSRSGSAGRDLVRMMLFDFEFAVGFNKKKIESGFYTHVPGSVCWASVV